MKKILFAAPLALAAGSLLASPASARDWNYGNPGQLRAEIAQLDRQIDRAPGLSNREERALEARADRLQSLYRAYARHGFTRAEVRSLENEIASLRVAIQRQAHDRNNHPGRNDRYDRHR
jgi:predicted RNase H-like nuclease (RuvC/YqgF family)